MLIESPELYKLEACEIVSQCVKGHNIQRGWFALMTDDSTGEGITVHGQVEAVDAEDYFRNANGFTIESIEQFDEVGETFAIANRDALGEEQAKAIEDHLCDLLNQDESVCDTLQEMALDLKDLERRRMAPDDRSPVS